MLRRANKYIDETTPWILAKSEENKPKLRTVIYNLLEVIRIGATLLKPFLPGTSDKIFAQIGSSCDSFEIGALESGKPVGKAEALFARIDEEKLMAEINAQIEAAKAKEEVIPAPEKMPEISYDKFMDVELRSAQIIACENVKGAKKLLKLQIDLGYEKRQVVSGIAKFYKPEDLIGKKVIVVANLKPVILCGVESYGMILASGEEEIRVVFLDENTPNGERIR